MVARVISAGGGKVKLRIESNSSIDIGDILIIEDKFKYYVKVTNVLIDSLLPNQFISEIAGHELEAGLSTDLFDDSERFYKVCEAKILKILINNKFYPPRTVPSFFTKARLATKEDFKFLETKGVDIGKLRLGTRVLDFNIKIPVNDIVSHHILITASTGKGKSNFAKVFVKGLMGLEGFSTIIFDPHNEYYGNAQKGLRDLRSDKLVYFTPKIEDFPGSERLIFFAEDMEPSDFFEVLNLTGPQKDALIMAERIYGKYWLKELLENRNVSDVVRDLEGKVQQVTISSLKRKLEYIFGGLVFTLNHRDSQNIVDKIKSYVKEGHTIIIDTSLIGDLQERLITTIIVKRLFLLYKYTKEKAPRVFEELPKLLILFEEAPRVLGKAVLEKGINVFAKIAREGRKFKVGLCAITQMPSLLPNEILSQMNTKVILGLPAPSDRQAVINSSAHDISDEESEIQMLDRGEAIITSPFLIFPLPVKIHKFEDLLKNQSINKEINITF